jgi:hypothetical protein
VIRLVSEARKDRRPAWVALREKKSRRLLTDLLTMFRRPSLARSLMSSERRRSIGLCKRAANDSGGMCPCIVPFINYARASAICLKNIQYIFCRGRGRGSSPPELLDLARFPSNCLSSLIARTLEVIC